MTRLPRGCHRAVLAVVAGGLVAAGGGCADDAPAAKPTTKDGQALSEGKTADPAALTGAKGGRGGGRMPKN